MIGERENFEQQTQYGSLVMRNYDIDGNNISAFYDSSNNLVFVLDNTVNSRKPNILLVINPEADKKWDEILSGDYGVDLETIRPKQDNKYQKFDIEYSGLPVYDALIKAYDDGDSLEESLNQLMILRDSAARHSAMTRLNVANEIISKTNATIVKTKESIVRLQARLKTLRAKLGEAKKSIGREPTKQSASKILKLESQIEATNEKLKRANERLKSAQRRLETATVDAELASQLLNQPSGEIKQVTKKQAPLVVPVKRKVVVKKQPEPEIEEEYEEEDFVDMDDNKTDDIVEETTTTEETETTEEEYKEEDTEKVEPLFKEDPQILDNDIAFKPISFEAPVVPEIAKSSEETPDLNHDIVMTEETTIKETEDEKEADGAKEQQSVLESIMPVPVVDESPVPVDEPETIEATNEATIEEKPLVTTEENTQEEPLELEVVKEDVRQYEPLGGKEITEFTEEKTDDEYAVMPVATPVTPVAPIVPQNAYNNNVAMIEETEPKRSKFFYYLLLILLIILAVFTLWLYQKNVKPSRPVLATSVEKTELPREQNTVFKKTNQKVKTSKQIKAPVTKQRQVDAIPAFLDEESVEVSSVKTAQKPVVTEKAPVIEENVNGNVVETTDSAPEVVNAIPVRVLTSGTPAVEADKGLTEEDVLAAKPEYQPGSKYDEMFVADENAEVTTLVDEAEYIEDDVIHEAETSTEVSIDTLEEIPQEVTSEYVETETEIQYPPFFDEEEAAYQAEQAGLYYEE